MKITKITIGRLHNLGNYEHIRYELTADVHEGESPATALIGMENILNALSPKRPAGVYSSEEIANRKMQLEEAKSMPAEKFEQRYYGQPRAKYLFDSEKQLAADIKRKEAWEAHRAKARKLLEDLGGAANFTDAKQNWDYDDDCHF